MWEDYYPSYVKHAESEKRQNAKYVARVPVDSKGGKKIYRYFYTNEAYQAYLKGEKSATEEKAVGNNKPAGAESKKNPVESLFAGIGAGIKSMSDNTKTKVNTFFGNLGMTVEKEAPKVLNKVVDKAIEVGKEIYDDEDNIWDVKSTNYDEKIAKIAETQEWKDIVARKDPEYIRKNSDGSMTYLIDDYLAKKKMPLLDIIDDIASFRPITLNKIEKDALVAGLKQQVIGKISLGVMAVGAVGKLLIEKSKLSQGSYDDEINNMKETIDAGIDYVTKTVEASKEARAAAEKASEDPNVALMVELVKNTNIVDDTKETKKAIDERKIVEAAKIIMNSDTIPEGVKANDYYELVESTLSNLSEEEIRMVNLMISAMMKGGK